MNWLDDFRTGLIERFGWTAPASAQELEARLTPVTPYMMAPDLKVPDVLWVYACGHRVIPSKYDPDSPWENMRDTLNH